MSIRGYDAPLFAIVGGTFTFIAFVVIAVLYPTVSVFGVGWLVLGVVVFVTYRRRQGLDLTSTHKVAIAQPVVDHEAEYDSVLVHFGDSGYDDQVLATARKLAARKRRGIHVLVTITVPNSMEIDAPMPDQDASARSIIEEAKVAGGGARDGPRRARARGPGGPPDRRGRRRHARGRDRDAAAAADRRRVAVRQDARDGADRAAVPRDHRVQPRRDARRAPARARGGAGGVSGLTLVMSLLMIGLGVAMIAVTLSNGGGPAAFGIVIGLLFVAAGGGRLWVLRRR